MTCTVVKYTVMQLSHSTSSSLQDPEGKPKKANIRDNRDGTYTVSYVPDMTGRYTITIKYGGDEIPYSPYRIHALPTGDASKCLVTGQRLVCPPQQERVCLPVSDILGMKGKFLQCLNDLNTT